MFVSPLVWHSCPPGRSSHVRQWILLSVMVTLLEMAFSMSHLKDMCLEDPANFAHQMHTIGSVDGRLWAITNDNWTVYELMPCQQNHSCMVVSSPLAIDTKWPKLAESAKSAAGAKDFDFTVNNSVVMDSFCFEHTAVAMGSSFITETRYFGFEFDANKSFKIKTYDATSIDPGLWISSDVKSKAYRLLNSGTKITQIDFINLTVIGESVVSEIDDSSMNICNVTQQDGGNLKVQFTNANCDQNMNWPVLKGVHYRNQFYFFASDKVYSFSDKVQTSPTSVETVSYVDFFHCHKPTTLSTSPSLSSKASSSVQAESTMLISNQSSTPPSDSVTTDTLDPFAGQKQGLKIVFLMGAVPIGLVISLCLFSITMDALEARSIRNKCTSSMHGRKGSKGHRASTRKDKQESRQQQPKVNRSKAKTSMDGSKVSMNKVAKPQVQAKRRHAGR